MGSICFETPYKSQGKSLFKLCDPLYDAGMTAGWGKWWKTHNQDQLAFPEWIPESRVRSDKYHWGQKKFKFFFFLKASAYGNLTYPVFLCCQNKKDKKQKKKRKKRGRGGGGRETK